MGVCGHVCVFENEREKEKEKVCACVYVCVYMYICVGVCVYIHTHTHTHTHAHAHNTHTHTHTNGGVTIGQTPNLFYRSTFHEPDCGYKHTQPTHTHTPTHPPTHSHTHTHTVESRFIRFAIHEPGFGGGVEVPQHSRLCCALVSRYS